MGIIVNAFMIFSGAVFGSIFKGKTAFKNFTIMGIGIMIISIVGFLENIYNVSGITLKSDELIIIVLALIIGTVIGDMLHMEERLSSVSNVKNKAFAAFVDSSVFFGVGGLQICGAIMLAKSNDSSLLYLKGMIDFPFAILFGASYGKSVVFSAVTVAFGQLIIYALSISAGSFLGEEVISGLCAMGYIILFFSGFNLLCKTEHKINNINMLPAVLIILIYYLFRYIWR